MKLWALVALVAIVASACAGGNDNEPGASLNWSRVPAGGTVLSGAGNQRMLSVTAGGPGLVAVGREETGADVDGAVWTSVDGLTWLRVPDEAGVLGGTGDQLMESVVAGGPGLVAVGRENLGDGFDGAVWTSVDGLAWLRVADEAGVLGGTGGQLMESVVAGGPGLVAVGLEESATGFDALVWTSVDGLTWLRVPDDLAAFGGNADQTMNSVTVGGPGLVAVGWEESAIGFDGAVWTSVDGFTWSRVPDEGAVFGGAGDQLMESVAAGGPGLVAVGWDGSGGELRSPTVGLDAAVWTSVDGLTWSRVPDDEAVLGGEGFQQLLSVTVGGPGVVAVGRDESGTTDFDAAVWSSVDGLTWSRVPHDEAVLGGVGFQHMRSVTVGGPGLVAVGLELGRAGADAAVWVTTTED
jgi:hypothetical protein